MIIRKKQSNLPSFLSDIKDQLYVNLIPYNPVDEHSQYQRSEQESVLSFYDTLKKRGINCKIRQEHGTDIDAACGQLRSKQIKKSPSNKSDFYITRYIHLNCNGIIKK